MPGVDGFEATRRIRELPTIAAQTPILALTASCAPGVREPAQDAGMDGFLQKPVDIKRLAAAIAQLATQSQAAPQSARPKFRMFNKTTATIKTTIVVSAAIRLPLEK
jgi:DNA-binding NarL/FixJ family response regulator